MSSGENAASRRVSRRDALRAAGAGAGAGVAGFLVACGGGGGSARTLPQLNPVQIQADAAVAGALVQGERAAIAAYRLGASHMQGADRRIAERFRAQEEAHERAPERPLRWLAAAAPPRRPAADDGAGCALVPRADSALRSRLD